MTIESPLEKKPAHILCVDDEPNVLKSLRRLFRGSEYIVHLADGGAKGLEVLEQEPIDLIISDMRMPQMDGAEFLTQAATRWPDVVRILLTGYADIESTVAAVNQGKIYSYCSKPWEDDEIKALVAKAIDEKRLREERLQLFEIINRQNDELKDLNNNLEERVEKRNEQLNKALKQLSNSHGVLKKQYKDAIKVFAKIVEKRPGILTGHSLYIANHGLQVAAFLNMSEKECDHVMYAGLLLQIGKMALTDDLLSKPYFLLDKKGNFLKHALEGAELLEDMEQLKDASILIKHQYERYDGSGLPDKLEGEEIPLGSRILAVIRDFISYKQGYMTGTVMTDDEVKELLVHNKKIYYDPNVVDTFLAIL